MFYYQSIQIVKKFGAFLLIIILLWSCSSPKQSPPNAPNTETDIVFDSIEKIHIDTIIANIHKTIREAGPAQKIPYTVYDPTDTIYFWILPENSARISLELNLPNGVEWPTFYVHDGDLIYVRYRQAFQDSTNSSASETMTYLCDQKIIYCEERGSTLGPDGYPGYIRQLPFQRSTRKPEEIKGDYHDYWLLILDQMKQHKLKPEFLN